MGFAKPNHACTFAALVSIGLGSGFGALAWLQSGQETDTGIVMGSLSAGLTLRFFQARWEFRASLLPTLASLALLLAAIFLAAGHGVTLLAAAGAFIVSAYTLPTEDGDGSLSAHHSTPPLVA